MLLTTLFIIKLFAYINIFKSYYYILVRHFQICCEVSLSDEKYFDPLVPRADNSRELYHKLQLYPMSLDAHILLKPYTPVYDLASKSHLMLIDLKTNMSTFYSYKCLHHNKLHLIHMKKLFL